MKSNIAIISLAIFSTTNSVSAQHAHLHVDSKWDECSFQLDPSLTQKEWHQFASEAANVVYFRPLTDAKPMGVGKFELSVLQWNTKIDENDGAWNNTFVHPDSSHWLIDGPELPFPGLTLRAGITSKIDAGIYWSERPGANYGVWAAQVQYNFLNDTSRNISASTRFNFSSLYGPDDLDVDVYGIDFIASKEFGLYSTWLAVTPYASVSPFLSHAHEKTEAVSLKDENVFGMQGAVGAVAKIKFVRLGVEYNMSRVNTLSYKLGVVINLKGKKE
jgi:hypothetical protein